MEKYGGYGVEVTQELVELLSRVRFPLAALEKISSKLAKYFYTLDGN